MCDFTVGASIGSLFVLPHLVVLSLTGSDVFSTSTDGQVLWWDIRKLVEPVETLPLVFPGYKPDCTLGGIVVEYESTMVSPLHYPNLRGSLLAVNITGS